MASTLVKIAVHIVFHIKTTSVIIRNSDIPLLHKYIGGIIRNVGSIPICVGGVDDHVHILCTLPKTMPLADFVRTIKANSSRWIKLLSEYYNSFEWQTGYGAFSVSPSLMDKTELYITTQAEHHKKQTFEDEYTLFLKSYHIDYDANCVFED